MKMPKKGVGSLERHENSADRTNLGGCQARLGVHSSPALACRQLCRSRACDSMRPHYGLALVGARGRRAGGHQPHDGARQAALLLRPAEALGGAAQMLRLSDEPRSMHGGGLHELSARRKAHRCAGGGARPRRAQGHSLGGKRMACARCRALQPHS